MRFFCPMQSLQQHRRDYDKILENGGKPSIPICIAALKACSSARDIESGFQIHSQLAQSGADLSNVHAANTLLDMYTKCGRLAEARRVFDAMLCAKNVVTWNILVRGFAERGQAELALAFFARMQCEGIAPESRTLVAALRACAKLAEQATMTCLERGFAIHSLAVRAGVAVESDVYVASSLLNVYATCGSLVDARRVFDAMQSRDVVTWNTMIRGYAQNGHGQVALELFVSMLDGYSPDARTYVAAILACTCLAGQQDSNKQICLEKGYAVHSHLLSKRIDLDNMYVASALVDMYSKCGSMEDSRRVFDGIRRPDVVLWTTLILGYVEIGANVLALQLFQDMQGGGGCNPDARTYVAALKACSASRSLETGMFIHSLAKNCGLELEVFVGSTLVDMYAKCNSMVDAEMIFERMPNQSVVTWNALMLGYVDNGMARSALRCFEVMQQRGFEPDLRSFLAAISACASLGELRTGIEIHSLWKMTRSVDIAESGEDLFFANALIDMYSKCGSVEHSRLVFDKLTRKSLVSWNAMIGAYAQSSGSEAFALELFNCMLNEGLFCPDLITFLGVIKACAGLADLETGKKVHAQVWNVGLETDFVVATALIDFYGKCGCMVDAREIFESIPVDSRHIVTWNSLLAGYCHQGDVKNVFGTLDLMKKSRTKVDGVTLLCVLTACCHAGLVEKGKEVFSEMCEEGLLSPGIEHYTCLVNLLGGANELDEALEVVRRMPVEADAAIWRTLLSACRKWRNVEIGRIAYEALLKLDDRDAVAYVLMANSYC